MKTIKPYQVATPAHIISPFGAYEPFRDIPHTGTDFAFPNAYGTPLLAPVDCVITKIITPGKILSGFEEIINGLKINWMEYGYGVEMKGVDGYYYLYWHCLGVFPVSENQMVRQGQIVAFMGNSGRIYRYGKLIPLEIRTDPPHLGTHLHAEKYTKDAEGIRTRYDFAKDIDWSIQVKVEPIDLITSARIIVSKIAGLVRDYLKK